MLFRSQTSVAVVRSGEGPAALARVAEDVELPLVDLTWSGGAACAVVPLLNLPDWRERRARAVREVPSLEIDEGAALVSVVGSELGGAALGAFLRVVSDAGAAPLTVSAGPLRVAAAISRDRLDDVQRALHARFVAASAP